MINTESKSIKQYSKAKEKKHDLVTLSFLKSFAELSKKIFRSSLYFATYGQLFIKTPICLDNTDDKTYSYLIDIKSEDIDYQLYWEVAPSEDAELSQKSELRVLNKGVNSPVIYLCLYTEDDGKNYYCFIVNVSKFATVDVTEHNEHLGNKAHSWFIKPCFLDEENISKDEEDVIRAYASVLDSKCFLSGEGTEGDPFKLDKHVLDASDDSFIYCADDAIGSKIYALKQIEIGDYYQNGDNKYEISDINAITSLVKGVELQVTGFISKSCDNDDLQGVHETSPISEFLLQGEALFRYRPYGPIQDPKATTYDEVKETVSTECVITNGDDKDDSRINGVFQSTRAEIARHADTAKHADEANHAQTASAADWAAAADTAWYFDEEKTLKHKNENLPGSFIRTGVTASNFMDSPIELPEIEFIGTNLASGSNLFCAVKVNKQGLVTEFTPYNTLGGSSIPYVKDTDDLYFRIDPTKSINLDLTYKASVGEVLNAFRYTKGDFSILSNDTHTAKIGILDYDYDNLEVCLIIPWGQVGDISSIGGVLTASGMLNVNNNQSDSHTFNIKGPDNVDCYLRIDTILSSGVAYSDNNPWLLYCVKQPTTEGQIDGLYWYGWYSIPKGQLYIYSDYDLVDTGQTEVDLIMQDFNDEYKAKFRSIFGEDPYFRVTTLKPKIVLGKDGLLISNGAKSYKIQITQDGVTAGEVTN